MKKYLTILLLLAAIEAKSQTKIKSYLGDSIVVVKGYRQLTPIIITVQGDTARSILWYVGPISRDSTASATITAIFYDKKGNTIGVKNIGVSESAYTKWSTLFTAIDTFLSNQVTRIVLH